MPQRDLADWWTRAGAFLLDQLIVGGLAAAIALAAAAAVHDRSDAPDRVLLYAIALPIALLYAPLLMARPGARNGQTLGKQAVGIRVVRTDGEPVTFWLGVLRTVVGQQLLTALTLYAYAVLDYLWPLRDPHRQALHDKLARTWVLRTAAAAAPAAPPPVEAPAHRWLPPQAPGA